jgi:Mce-associated membrane protein
VNGDERTPAHGAPGHPAAEALALAEEAEAEAAEAEALAAAARARARAIRLRRQAQSPPAGVPDKRDEPTPDGVNREITTSTATDVLAAPQEDEKAAEDAELSDDAEAVEDADSAAGQPRRSWRHRLGRRVWARVALGLTFVVACALLAASGYLIWQHRDAAAQRHHSAEFAAAARQGVVSLMTLDFNHAKDDVQRVIDNSTGQFKDDFQSRADDFTKVVQDSKVVTKGTVNAAAVQSMNANSAVVLVAASSQVTNATGAQNEPRAWRLSVTVQRDGPQIKMARVEFVP